MIVRNILRLKKILKIRKYILVNKFGMNDKKYFLCLLNICCFDLYFKFIIIVKIVNCVYDK